MANIFPDIYGNELVKSILGGDILSGKNAHAYIIAGPRGSGKHMLAEQAAASLGCLASKSGSASFPCGKCEHCLKVARKVAPDVIYIGRNDKATIGVEAVRELRSSLYITPNESAYKVYIIEDADYMTPQAQNALLLSLEEPPKFVIFFILTEAPENLLETIRSRAPVLRTETFSPSKIVGYIKSRKEFASLSDEDEKRLNEIASLSGGSIGQALADFRSTNADKSSRAENRGLAKDIFTALCSSSQRNLIDAIQQMPKQRADCLAILELVKNAFRDACVIKKGAAVDLLFFSSPDECKSVIKNIYFAKLYRIEEAISDATHDIERNVSQQTVLTSLFFRKYN